MGGYTVHTVANFQGSLVRTRLRGASAVARQLGAVCADPESARAQNGANTDKGQARPRQGKMSDVVVVTGASGFVAGELVKALLVRHTWCDLTSLCTRAG